MPDDTRDQTLKDLCLLKRAIKTLLKKHPEGMGRAEICRRLMIDADFSGTYRNLHAQANSILNLLIEEGKVTCRGSGSARIYIHAG
jgi:hypothetical protein